MIRDVNMTISMTADEYEKIWTAYNLTDKSVSFQEFLIKLAIKQL